MSQDKSDKPRLGDGTMPGRTPVWKELFMRRSAKDNKGLPSDIQPIATRKFRKEAGKPKTKKEQSRWFRD